jgi:hypothetical protein
MCRFVTSKQNKVRHNTVHDHKDEQGASQGPCQQEETEVSNRCTVCNVHLGDTVTHRRFREVDHFNRGHYN